MAQTQVLGPLFAAFLGALAESCFGNRVAGTQTGIPVWDTGVPSTSLT